MSTVAGKKTHRETQSELNAIRKAGREINRTKESSREFLIKHGFITKSGQPGKAYR